MLDILVTGFPNSGTSFMLEFVKEATGLSPGSEHNLKGADSHNRYGYWEHLPIRNVSWSLMGGGLSVRNLPDGPLPRNEEVAENILCLAERDNVQVYKDNALPIVYRSFPEDVKVITIGRKPQTIYDRYYADRMGEKAFRKAWCRYWDLNKLMSTERQVLVVFYEWFDYDPKFTMGVVCRYLDAPYREGLRETWRPRCAS
jgi:hypothetical protein